MWIICADCGKQFPFSPDEQRYYGERNYAIPKRCKPCRHARKSQKILFQNDGFPTAGGLGGYRQLQGNSGGYHQDRPAAQNNYRPRPGGGGTGGGPEKSFRGNDRKLYQIRCADCGANSTVPFKPFAGKPVYCKECHSKRSRGGNRRGGQGIFGARGSR